MDGAGELERGGPRRLVPVRLRLRLRLNLPLTSPRRRHASGGLPTSSRPQSRRALLTMALLWPYYGPTMALLWPYYTYYGPTILTMALLTYYEFEAAEQGHSKHSRAIVSIVGP